MITLLFHKHICRPKIIHVLGIRKEVGGETWYISSEEFDELFCGQVVWSVTGIIWGIQEIAHNECIKIYRGKEQ